MASSYLLLELLLNATSRRYTIPTSYDLSSKRLLKPRLRNSQQYRCRVCLQKGSIPIIGKHYNNIQISRSLLLICNIEVHEDDNFPQYLCKSCFTALIAAVKLREKATKSQLVLKNYRSSKKIARSKKIKAKLENTKPVKTPPISDDESASQQNERNSFISAESDIEYNFERSKPQQKNKNEMKKISKSEIEKHFKSILTKDNEAVYECRTCKKVFKESSTAEHILQHPQYVCEVCGKSFKQYCVLIRHQVIHTDNLPYKCKLCPYKGRCKEYLQNHLKIHSTEYRYQCSQCQKKFMNSGNYNHHLRRHGLPNFPCTVCNRPFYENSSLKRHVEAQHMGIIEPHKCSICGNFYKNRQNLKIHEIKAHKRKKILFSRAIYLKHENAT